jgi:hypothetical protein
MSSPDTRHPTPGTLLLLAGVALAAALYFAGAASNPPGFYIDEASVAYNAHLVAGTGRDEHGESFPLFFRAFGEYKNPVYIYLLAAVFKVSGPSIAAARLLSAALGVAAALGLGLLAARASRSRAVGAAVALSALLTPWLFEGTRLVFEVAAFPASIVLLLLATERAARRAAWGWREAALTASALALVTYAYAVGRALGPLLAAGLLLFLTRARLPGILKTWALYAVSLAPLFVFARRHPGALTGRFGLLTYVKPESGLLETAGEFARRYLLNVNPWRLLAVGEENVRDHVPGSGALLFVTAWLAVAGLLLALRRGARTRDWWRFVVYGLLASVVPASLTGTEFPQLRLLAFPVFLHALTIPAWAWLLGVEGKTPEAAASVDQRRTAETEEHGRGVKGRARGFATAFVLLLVVAQGLYFQWLFRRDPFSRGYVFDDRFARKVLAPALSTGARPVHLFDAPGRVGYIQALWHGTLAGLDASHFLRLAPGESPPAGSVVVSTEESCAGCRLLVRHLNYIVYAVPPTELRPRAAPLPPEGFRAELTLNAAPELFKAGQASEVNVLVRNTGGASWPAVGGEGGRHAVSLRSRWLRADATPLAAEEEGESALPFDLEPGDVAGWNHPVRAPAAPGEYVLELDLVQEGVARFGERGSATLRRAARVEE